MGAILPREDHRYHKFEFGNFAFAYIVRNGLLDRRVFSRLSLVH